MHSTGSPEDFQFDEEKSKIFFTNIVKSLISPPEEAASRLAIYLFLCSKGITHHEYPPEANMQFIINRPIRPFPSPYG